MSKIQRLVNAETLCTVISGSFRKHLSKIINLKVQLENSFVTVLSPAGNHAVNPQDEFVVLDSDPVTHPKLLQDSVFAKIRRSTFLVVANFDGYLGKAAILEIGYAVAIGISIYTVEKVDDPNLSPYCSLLSDVFPNLELVAKAEPSFKEQTTLDLHDFPKVVKLNKRKAAACKN